MKRCFLILVTLFCLGNLTAKYDPPISPEVLDYIKAQDEKTLGVFKDGNSLYAMLIDLKDTPESALSYAMACGYISGIFDCENGMVFFSLGGKTLVQVVDVVKKFLKDHPSMRHKGAFVLCMMAMAEAWPILEKEE